MALKPRHERFVRHYLTHLNATRAAVEAGYKTSSAQQAWRLLHRPDVAAAVQAGREALAERTNITAQRVLREYARLAFSDIRRMAEPAPDREGGGDGTPALQLKPLEALSDDDAAAVQELTQRAGTRMKIARIKLHDKERALAALARHLGLFETRPYGDPIARQAMAEDARAVLAARIEALAQRMKEEAAE